MPKHNGFRHQAYSTVDVNPDWQITRPVSSELELVTQADTRQQWKSAPIDVVYLVHGTFTGDDALGIARLVERYSASWADFGRRVGKRWVDRISEDVGNYPSEYQQQMATWLNTTLAQTSATRMSLPVRRFDWSSENLHTGRAIAAIELLNQLRLGMANGEHNVLLWGHSHAGNVFAIMTNLLGGTESDRERFFRAIAGYVDHQSRIESPRPHRRLPLAAASVRQWLDEDAGERLNLSIVTFGTPVRYGWETRGYCRLLHVIHHRPVNETRKTRAKFPLSIDEIANARHGDVIQQLGIAGTDFLPPLVPASSRRTERRLARLLQKGYPRRNLWTRLKLGVRVPDEGRTLLIDYPDHPPDLRQKLWGHAIYTSSAWMAYHLKCVAQEWFG